MAIPKGVWIPIAVGGAALSPVIAAGARNPAISARIKCESIVQSAGNSVVPQSEAFGATVAVHNRSTHAATAPLFAFTMQDGTEVYASSSPDTGIPGHSTRTYKVYATGVSSVPKAVTTDVGTAWMGKWMATANTTTTMPAGSAVGTCL